MESTRGVRLGELLIRMRLINSEQLADALGEQANLKAGKAQRQFRIGEILVFKRALNLNQLQAALRAQAQSSSEVTSQVRSAPSLKRHPKSVEALDEPSEISRVIKRLRYMFSK